MARQEVQRMTTGKLTALYAWLATPDIKFKAEGEYYVTAVVDPESAEWKELEMFLTPLVEEALEKAREGVKPADAKLIVAVEPWTDELDSEGDPTGRIKLRFKQNAKVTRKRDNKVFDIRPKVFDAKGVEIPVKRIPQVGKGSVVRVRFSTFPYVQKGDPKRKVPPAAGISLRLEAAQLVEVVAYGKDAADFGFGEEEGYTFDPNAAPYESFESEDSGNNTDNSDF